MEFENHLAQNTVSLNVHPVRQTLPHWWLTVF